MKARQPPVVDVDPDGPCPVAGCTGHPPTSSPVLVAVKPEDARNFRVGMRLVWPHGEDRPRRPRWRDKLRAAIRRVLWWRQVRYETTAVDAARGRITQERLRWSWRRWRWERETYQAEEGRQ